MAIDLSDLQVKPKVQAKKVDLTDLAAQPPAEQPKIDLSDLAVKAVGVADAIIPRVPTSIKETIKTAAKPFTPTSLYPKALDVPAERGFGAMSGGMGGGMAALLDYYPSLSPNFKAPLEGTVKKVAGKLSESSKAAMPENPNIAEELMSAAGSSAAPFIISLPLGGALGSLAKFGRPAVRFAQWAGTAGLEAMMESGPVFKDLVESGMDEAEASARTQANFLANAVVIGLTKKFGLFADKAKGIKKALLSAPLEATQEMFQEISSSISKGEEPDWANVLKAGGLGAVLGPGMSGVVDVANAETEPIAPNFKPAQQAPAATKLYEPVVEQPKAPPTKTLEGPAREIVLSPETPAQPVAPETPAPIKQDMGADIYYDSPNLTVYAKPSTGEGFAVAKKGGEIVFKSNDLQESLAKAQELENTAPNIPSSATPAERPAKAPDMAPQTPSVSGVPSPEPARAVELRQVPDATRPGKSVLSLINEEGGIVASGFKNIKEAVDFSRDNNLSISRASSVGKRQTIEPQKERGIIPLLRKFKISDKAEYAGDLKAMDIRGAVDPRVSKITNNLDGFREQLKELGYIGEDATIKDVLGLIQQESVSGKPTPRAGQEYTDFEDMGPLRSEEHAREQFGNLDQKLRTSGLTKNEAQRYMEIKDRLGLPGDESAVLKQYADALEAEREFSGRMQIDQSKRDIAKINDDISQLKNIQFPENTPAVNREKMRGRLISANIEQIRTDLKNFASNFLPDALAQRVQDRVQYSRSLKALESIAKWTKGEFEKLPYVAQSESTKGTIERTSGLTPVEEHVRVSQRAGLRSQLQFENRAAKEGFREGKKLTKEEMVNKMLDQREKVKEVTQYIQERIPKSEQANLLKVAAHAVTDARVRKLKGRTDAARENIVSKQLGSSIKQMAKPDLSIDVNYQKKIEDLVKDIDMAKPTAATVSKLKSLSQYLQTHGKGLVPDEAVAELGRLTKRPLSELSNYEKAELADRLARLKTLGRVLRQMKLWNDKKLRDAEIKTAIGSTKNQDPKGKDPTISDMAGKYNRSVLHVPRVMDEFDGVRGYSGWNAKRVKQIGAQETIAKMEESLRKQELQEKITSIKDFSDKESKIALYHLYKDQANMQSAAQEMLERNGISVEEALMTPEIKKLIEVSREAVSKDAAEIAAIFETINNKIFRFVENYFPAKRVGDFSGEDDAVKLQGRLRKTKTEQGFAIQREPDSTAKLRDDLFGILDDAIGERVWYKHMQPLLANTAAVVKSKEFKSHSGQVVAQYWADYLDVVARRGWSAGAKPEPTLRKVRKNLGVSVLGFNPGSIVKQPLAALSAMGYAQMNYPVGTSAKIAAELLRGAINPAYAEAYIKDSPALMQRYGGEYGMEEVFGDSKIINSFYDKLVRSSMRPLQKADVYTAAAVQRTIEGILKKDGVANAKQEAEFMMNLLSGNSEIAYRPLVLSSGEMARTFFTFQSFALSEWGMLAHDIFKGGYKSDRWSKKWGALMASLLFIGAKISEDLISAAIYEMMSGQKAKNTSKYSDLVRTAAMAGPSAIPFFGPMIESFAQGYAGRSTIPALKSLEDVGYGVKGAITYKTKSARRRAAIRGTEAAIALTARVPGLSQISNFIESNFAKKRSKNRYSFQ